MLKTVFVTKYIINYHIIQKSQFNIQMLFRNLIDFYS